jgi:phosphatidylserine/phosphatidylglycerophosphate/cardiolipin synthase-like enzyme
VSGLAQQRFHVASSSKNTLVVGNGPWYLDHKSEASYKDYVQKRTRGLVVPLINGRSSNSGADVDLTEPLNEMQKVIQATGAGDFVYLSAWFFEPNTSLTAGNYGSASTWGEFFADRASAGVKIRIIINDFDPVSNLDKWLKNDSLDPLNAIVSRLPAASQNNLKYIVSIHPAHVGLVKSLFAGQGGRDIHVASHHQKFMVVKVGNEMTAFCGGLDIESRKTPALWSYSGLIGWHDVHVKLQGPITRDLEKEFIMRWNREKGSTTKPPLSEWESFETLTPTPLTPDDDSPDKKVHWVQMLRTVSEDATWSPHSTEREDIMLAYERGIANASHYLYLENQYFRSTRLADAIVNRGKAVPDLIVIMVVVATAAADDGANAITEHGDYLQYETFRRIAQGLGSGRFRLYTMKNRAVHSKLILADDRWMCVGSANANVRSFSMDSELNIQMADPILVSDFRVRLWAHNLGFSVDQVRSWPLKQVLAKWDDVATANDPLDPPDMTGEGIIAFDYRSSKGKKHISIPDALVELDFAPEGKLFAGIIPEQDRTVRVA